ncbi:MAG: histidine--tRNA ligase [Actinomycetales bacterium]
MTRAERPRPLSGFPEWLPGERLAEQLVVDHLRRTFELAGFVPLETRAVEPLSQLLRKGEIDKEVYVVRRLHEEPGEAADLDDDALALHFDLTVPFARYVLENAGKLDFPLRRYQIQKVWRGERPQEGRYREFRQADIDVVGRDTLPFHHDVDIAQVMAEALSGLPVPPITLQLNNRRLIQGFYEGLGIDDAEVVAAVLRAVDKLDKIGPAGVREVLVGQEGLAEPLADSCLQLSAIRTSDTSFVDQVRALGVKGDLLDTGLAELAEVMAGATAAASERVTVVADLSIARGLDYYTGTVYETRMAGFESLGSICSGGRYDALASDGRSTYPGVGISFGVTRTLGPLFARGLVRLSRPTPTCVLIAVPDEEHRASCRTVALGLRSRGIAAEVSPSAAKYGKQIRYAERRGVPYVWFPSAATESGIDEVRDIRTGEQVPADAAWSPPPSDLTPHFVDAD